MRIKLRKRQIVNRVLLLLTSYCFSLDSLCTYKSQRQNPSAAIQSQFELRICTQPKTLSDSMQISSPEQNAHNFQTTVLRLSFTCPTPHQDCLTILQVVTRHQTRRITLAHNLCLPPSIILVPRHRQDISLGKGELFRDGALVHVHCTCYDTH